MSAATLSARPTFNDPFSKLRIIPVEDYVKLGTPESVSACPVWDKMIREDVLLQYKEYREASDVVDMFEREVKLNGESLRSWFNYLKLKHSFEFRLLLYIRALHNIPVSYKLWWPFLCELDQWAGRVKLHPDHVAFQDIHCLFKVALTFLPKMPKIWLKFCDFLWKRRRLVTQTRKMYDEALRTIALTQHFLIWDKYIAFALETGLSTTVIPLLKRYMMIRPDRSEILAVYLEQAGHYDEAAAVLSRVCVAENFDSMQGKTRQQMWMDLCTLVAGHPHDIKSVDPDAIMRQALRLFPDAVSTVWCCLAGYHAARGNFDLANGIFWEALETIASADDFKEIYDAAASFLETAVQTALKDIKGCQDETKLPTLTSECNYRMQCLNSLISRRAELLSAVRIRRNPDDVLEWFNRIQLFCGQGRTATTAADSSWVSEGFRTLDKSKVTDPRKIIETFAEAVTTVNPLRSTGGSPALLWISFANFYELHDDLGNARATLKKGCDQPFKGLDPLVSIWCERVELELRHRNPEAALAIAREAVMKPTAKMTEEHAEDELFWMSPQTRLWRSTRLWSLLADLEENFGTFESLKSVYDKMFDLKTITVEQVLIYAELLEKRKHFELAFQTYEKGVFVFRWPHVFDIWIVYLSKFVARYGTRKVDRARELFEEAITDIPPQYACKLFFMYAKFEEHYGLIRYSLAVLHRATKKVLEEEKLLVYQLLIASTAEHFGIVKTRPIFEEAIANLPDANVLQAVVAYADLEIALMEYDRARAILEHGSQFANPKKDSSFWTKWRQFEVKYGDEETFRDMIRKRRAVQAQFEEASALSFDEELLKELHERTTGS